MDERGVIGREQESHVVGQRAGSRADRLQILVQVGFALEQSTTDIARELTNLIETQRAYSSNAKIIQTVDEMLQETTNIKR